MILENLIAHHAVLCRDFYKILVRPVDIQIFDLRCMYAVMYISDHDLTDIISGEL